MCARLCCHCYQPVLFATHETGKQSNNPQSRIEVKPTTLPSLLKLGLDLWPWLYPWWAMVMTHTLAEIVVGGQAVQKLGWKWTYERTQLITLSSPLTQSITSGLLIAGAQETSRDIRGGCQGEIHSVGSVTQDLRHHILPREGRLFLLLWFCDHVFGSICCFVVLTACLQCFDAIRWTAGRASTL